MDASSARVYWTFETIHSFKLTIGNPQVIVSVQIVPCDAMKALRELDIRKLVTCSWVQEKAHGLPKCFTIVGEHVAIKSENKGSIAHYSGDSNLST